MNLFFFFCNSAWLKEGDHPTIMKLNQRIEAITGLDVSTAEELQVSFVDMVVLCIVNMVLLSCLFFSR